jgi:ribosomal protein S6--L-glutamate ligase
MKPKLAILGPRRKSISPSTKRLICEAKASKFRVEYIPLVNIKLRVNKGLEILHDKTDISKFDYVLPRIDSKRAIIGYPVIRFLDNLDVRKPYPAETIHIAHNKFLTLEQLVKHKIKVPETYLTGSKESAMKIIDKYKLPLMIKLLSGFGGKGVMVMESKEAAKSVINAMNTLKQEVLIEKFLPNPGEDIRGFVAGDEIIGSFKRVAPTDDNRTNIKSGGRGIDYKLTSEMVETCFKCAKAIKSRLCAVDMIESKNSINVIEVNINPGIQGIEKATNINIAKRIMDFIHGEIKK